MVRNASMNARQAKIREVALLLGCAFLLQTAGGCAAQTKIPEAARTEIATRHAGQFVELRTSCYYGDFYDENQRWLLSPYQFDATSHIVDLDNKAIHPPHQRGIIPAGTKFVVDQVEFPAGIALAQRMFTTPRNNPWVFMRPAPTETRAPQPSKVFIWVLPTELDTPEAFEAAMAKNLAPDGEVSKWLGTVRPTVRVAIETKDIVAGMTLRELTASQGDPQHWYVDARGKERATVAWFPAQEAWLINDVVVDVKPSRAVGSTPPAPATGPATAPAPAPAAPSTPGKSTGS